MKKRILLITSVYLSVPVFATLFGMISMLINHFSFSDIFFGSLLTFVTFLFFPILIIGKESIFAIPIIFLIALILFLFVFIKRAISK